MNRLRLVLGNVSDWHNFIHYKSVDVDDVFRRASLLGQSPCK